MSLRWIGMEPVLLDAARAARRAEGRDALSFIGPHGELAVERLLSVYDPVEGVQFKLAGVATQVKLSLARRQELASLLAHGRCPCGSLTEPTDNLGYFHRGYVRCLA